MTVYRSPISDIDTGILGEVYDGITGDESGTVDDWKARTVENSPVAWMNQFLNDGPLEDFDRFVLTGDLDPGDEEDAYPDDHHSIDLLTGRPVAPARGSSQPPEHGYLRERSDRRG